VHQVLKEQQGEIRPLHALGELLDQVQASAQRLVYCVFEIGTGVGLDLLFAQLIHHPGP